MTEEAVFSALRTSIASVWELELLLLLHRSRARQWNVGELVRELRASPMVVNNAARRLCSQGLALESAQGLLQFRPPDDATDKFVRSLEVLYATKPASVIKEIMSRPNEKLKSFSDAFRIKER